MTPVNLAKADLTKTDTPPTTDLSEFSPTKLLARMSGTLSGWITTLTSIAAVIFAGVSLGEYVKLPATADAVTALIAQRYLLAIVFGFTLILGASGFASAMQAASQDGAFKARDKDPLRFFPKQTAPDLLMEYKDEVLRFNAARGRADSKGMQEATFWMAQHSEKLWLWLDAYRTRKAGGNFKLASILIAVGVFITGSSTIGFADAMRRMKSPLPADVLVQGPKAGMLVLREKAQFPEGLAACAKLDTSEQSTIPVTVMKVVAATAEQKVSSIEYMASVVPPLTTINECKVRVYLIASTTALLLTMPEKPPVPEATASKTPKNE